MTFQFQVPALGEAPSDELVERLHADVPGNWEGDDSGMVFHNDHFHGDQKVRNAAPGDWVVIDRTGAEVYKTILAGVEVVK
jgi:hypothetical protein